MYITSFEVKFDLVRDQESKPMGTAVEMHLTVQPLAPLRVRGPGNALMCLEWILRILRLGIWICPFIYGHLLC